MGWKRKTDADLEQDAKKPSQSSIQEALLIAAEKAAKINNKLGVKVSTIY